eukprot:11209378-Ditylum_brightwellii.AAC.1
MPQNPSQINLLKCSHSLPLDQSLVTSFGYTDPSTGPPSDKLSQPAAPQNPKSTPQTSASKHYTTSPTSLII